MSATPSETLTSYRDSPAFLMLMVAVLGLSFKAIFAKFAYASGYDVDSLLMVRFALAVPLFWFGLKVVSGAWPLLPWSEWRASFGAGCLFFMATLTDLTAVSLLDAGISRLVLFTFPAIILVISAIQEKRWPDTQNVIAFGVIYSGLVMAVVPGVQDGSLNGFGLTMAVLAAISYAAYLASSQSIMKRQGSGPFTAISGTTTCALMLVYFCLFGDLDNLVSHPEAFKWSAAIAVFCTAIPFFMLFEGIRRFGAERAAMIALSGPVITMIFAWFLLGERITLVQGIGFVVTIGGVGALEILNRRKKSKIA